MPGGRLNTRQRMINMMYLVLISIMALNVSREILDSFITIDHGQKTSRGSLEDRTSEQMAVFQSRANEHPQKFELPYQTAQSLRTEADALVRYINRIKAQCIAETDGRTNDGRSV